MILPTCLAQIKASRGAACDVISHRGGPIPRCRGTSLIRNTPLLGPYSRTIIPMVLRWSSRGVGVFLWARYPCSRRSHMILPTCLASSTFLEKAAPQVARTGSCTGPPRGKRAPRVGPGLHTGCLRNGVHGGLLLLLLLLDYSRA